MIIPTQRIQKNISCAVESLVTRHWRDRYSWTFLRGPWHQFGKGLVVTVSWLVPTLLQSIVSLSWDRLHNFWDSEGMGQEEMNGTCLFYLRQGGVPCHSTRTKAKTKARKRNSHIVFYLLSIQMWRKMERDHMDDPSWPTLENIRYELRVTRVHSPINLKRL